VLNEIVGKMSDLGVDDNFIKEVGQQIRKEKVMIHSADYSALGALETREPLTPEQIDGTARDLLGRLTVEEKIGLISGDTSFFPGMARMSGGGYNRHPLTTASAIPLDGRGWRLRGHRRSTLAR
jgi:hypothetical protein